MTITTLTMISAATFYFFSGHPVTLVILILTQALAISVSIYLHIKISWFSFVLFLIFLGGLMVLFVYITSLASNEAMSMKKNNFLLVTTMILLVWTMIELQKHTSLESYTLIMTSKKCIQSIFSNNPKNMILITMIYLLLTLIIVVKISNLKEAPIKSIT